MLPRIAIASCLLASSAAFAAAPLVQDSPPADPKKNQKVEHIHVEDSAVKIDETRYAGQAESITVQPKDGMPAYEIVPPSMSHPPANDNRRAVPGGERVWNVLHF
ncbi:MAG TPA: hypothetical protein VIE63_02740 [Ramlibacter sp.]